MSMQAILSASQSMARMQTMQSTRTQMQGTANVLRSESKQDGGNEKKDAMANELEEKSNKLMGDFMAEFTDVTEALKPDENADAEGVSKGEEAAKNPSKTDTLELSKSAGKHIGEGTHAKPAVLEAVTYKVDGSAKPSTPDKTAPTFRTTA